MIYMQHIQKNHWYLLDVMQDLFDTWLVMRSFGSLTSRRGRTIYDVCDNEADAWQQLTEIEYSKRQRGYVYADFVNVELYSLCPQTIAELAVWHVKIEENIIKPKHADLITNQQSLF